MVLTPSTPVRRRAHRVRGYNNTHHGELDSPMHLQSSTPTPTPKQKLALSVSPSLLPFRDTSTSITSGISAPIDTSTPSPGSISTTSSSESLLAAFGLVSLVPLPGAVPLPILGPLDDSALLQTPFGTHTPLGSHHLLTPIPGSQRYSLYSPNDDDLHSTPCLAFACPDTPTPHSYHSQKTMPIYPETPSPPASYGINGSLIVGSVGVGDSIMAPQNNANAQCQPLVPLHPDVFTSSHHSKSHRSALRPSISSNGNTNGGGAINSSWTRRVLGEDINNNVDNVGVQGVTNSTSHPNQVARPSSVPGIPSAVNNPSVNTLISSIPVSFAAAPPPPPPPTASHPQTFQHEAYPQSHSQPHPQHIESTHPHSSHYSLPPHSQQHILPPPQQQQHTHTTHPSTHPMSINHNTPQYSDELSFHSTNTNNTSASYAGSYDSSFDSNASGWGHGQHQPQSGFGANHYHPYAYYGMGNNKLQEPILASGEVPAPRPPMSYAALIGEALLLSPPPHHLYVSEISDSIKRRYPYYRQNPTKIYNGVRHQTSMCKAFVKLPRPYGDQSGGAKKWAIRAGCESWFTGGGYHPPGSNAAAAVSRNHRAPGSPSSPLVGGGKAKATARAKRLAIGTGSASPPPDRKPEGWYQPFSAGSGGGPSVGPAFDGTSRSYQYPLLPPPAGAYHGGPLPPPPPPPSQSSAQGYQPGYQYLPLSSHAHAHSGNGSGIGSGPQPMYVPVWGPYPSQGQQSQGPGVGPVSPDSVETSPPLHAKLEPELQQQHQQGNHVHPYYSSYPYATSAYPQPYGGQSHYAAGSPPPPPPQGQAQGQQWRSGAVQSHHGFPQSDERPGTQSSETGSVASFDDTNANANGDQAQGSSGGRRITSPAAGRERLLSTELASPSQ